MIRCELLKCKNVSKENQSVEEVYQGIIFWNLLCLLGFQRSLSFDHIDVVFAVSPLWPWSQLALVSAVRLLQL